MYNFTITITILQLQFTSPILQLQFTSPILQALLAQPQSKCLLLLHFRSLWVNHLQKIVE
jgi:hypothetical protein